MCPKDVRPGSNRFIFSISSDCFIEEFTMAKLSTAKRKSLSAKSFAEPKERKYPIENKAHAKNALARVSQFGTPAEKTKVRKAVKAKYPSIGKKDK
jgi:hypothetical protein